MKLLLSAPYLTLVGIVVALAGCSGVDDNSAPPWMAGGASGVARFNGDDVSCDTDEAESCSVVIQQASGITSCFQGVKYCIDGEWTACAPADALAPSGK